MYYINKKKNNISLPLNIEKMLVDLIYRFLERMVSIKTNFSKT